MSGDNWETPDELYQVLNKEFNFQFDLCASKDNTKCPEWSDDIESFAISEQVYDFSRYWMNPPYSRKNIDNAIESATIVKGRGSMVVCLVRFDPTADWFKRYVDGVASEVRMLDRRVKFKGAPSAYNFPCCIPIYTPYKSFYTNYYSWGWK